MTKHEPKSPSEAPAESGHSESFCTAKHAILRSLAAVYAVAFLAAWQQNGALIGENGLVPAKPAFDRERAAAASALDGFMSKPSLFWWLPFDDAGLDGVSAAGLCLSLLVMLGLHSSVAMLSLWLLYFTVVSAAEGSSFYAYGWESQLLETGFLAVFLPLLAPRAADPSRAMLWLFRWLAFRISLGAGLIKLRGGSCWEARTCLHYHFETQPVPSPASFVFHFLPRPSRRLRTVRPPSALPGPHRPSTAAYPLNHRRPVWLAWSAPLLLRHPPAAQHTSRRRPGCDLLAPCGEPTSKGGLHTCRRPERRCPV